MSSGRRILDSYYIEKGNFNATLPRKAVKGQPPSVEGDKHNDAKCTQKKAGQTKYGTFKEEGISKHQQMIDKIRAIRGDKKAFKKMVRFEKKFLKSHLQDYMKQPNATETGKRKADDDELDNNRAKLLKTDEWDGGFDASGWNTDDLESDDDDDDGEDDDGEDENGNKKIHTFIITTKRNTESEKKDDDDTVIDEDKVITETDTTMVSDDNDNNKQKDGKKDDQSDSSSSSTPAAAAATATTGGNKVDDAPVSI